MSQSIEEPSIIDDARLRPFTTLLPASQTLTPASPSFAQHTKPWSLAYDAHPALVLVPRSVPEVQAVVAALCASDADFAVRGRGVGSASARDVVVSMRAFDGVEWAREGVVDVGAGCDWGDVDAHLADIAPGYVVVGARCPYVGVAGSTLAGGLSWLSHEKGLGSDPANLLDVHIALADGRALWASEDPELLWALRGGGGNFGVATKFRFRAHKHASRIFAGMIFFPTSSLHELSRGVSRFATHCHDENLALHLFIVDFSKSALHGGSREPQLMAIIFDARGEAHGRSADGFGWAFDVPGARDAGCREMPLSDVHELQRSSEASHGVAVSWLQAAMIDGDGVDESFLVRGFEWYEEVARREDGLGLGTFVLLEIMQKATFTSAGSPAATAWPHGSKGRQHILQLATGAAPQSFQELSEVQNRALEVLAGAPARISGKASHAPGDFLPNFLLPNHNLEAVFAGNWEKLRKIKAKFDPNGRFNKTCFIPPANS